MTPRVVPRPTRRPAMPSFRRHRPPPLENLPTEFEQRPLLADAARILAHSAA